MMVVQINYAQKEASFSLFFACKNLKYGDDLARGVIFIDFRMRDLEPHYSSVQRRIRC